MILYEDNPPKGYKMDMDVLVVTYLSLLLGGIFMMLGWFAVLNGSPHYWEYIQHRYRRCFYISENMV